VDVVHLAAVRRDGHRLRRIEIGRAAFAPEKRAPHAASGGGETVGTPLSRLETRAGEQTPDRI
jgi:hypothetical protein